VIARPLGVTVLLTATAVAAGEVDSKVLLAEVRRVAPPVTLTKIDRVGQNFVITGTAKGHELVAEFMKKLFTLVRTPKGFGRLIERRRDNVMGRVELYSRDAQPIEDFFLRDLVQFEGDLVKATQVTSDAGVFVRFELNFREKPRSRFDGGFEQGADACPWCEYPRNKTDPRGDYPEDW
jgi:hypothetical protein